MIGRNLYPNSQNKFRAICTPPASSAAEWQIEPALYLRPGLYSNPKPGLYSKIYGKTCTNL